MDNNGPMSQGNTSTPLKQAKKKRPRKGNEEKKEDVKEHTAVLPLLINSKNREKKKKVVAYVICCCRSVLTHSLVPFLHQDANDDENHNGNTERKEEQAGEDPFVLFRIHLESNLML